MTTAMQIQLHMLFVGWDLLKVENVFKPHSDVD